MSNYLRIEIWANASLFHPWQDGSCFFSCEYVSLSSVNLFIEITRCCVSYLYVFALRVPLLAWLVSFRSLIYKDEIVWTLLWCAFICVGNIITFSVLFQDIIEYAIYLRLSCIIFVSVAIYDEFILIFDIQSNYSIFLIWCVYKRLVLETLNETFTVYRYKPFVLNNRIKDSYWSDVVAKYVQMSNVLPFLILRLLHLFVKSVLNFKRGC